LQQTQYPGAFLAKYLSYLAGFIQHAPTANPISLNSGLSLCFLTIVEASSNVAGVGGGWQPKTCIESPSPVLFYALTLAPNLRDIGSSEEHAQRKQRGVCCC